MIGLINALHNIVCTVEYLVYADEPMYRWNNSDDTCTYIPSVQY
jgi:hypothetical protein